MNKLLLLLSLTLVPILMRGQSVRFIEPDKTWHVRAYNDANVFDLTFCFTAKSDILINDVHYMQMFETTDNKMRIAGIFREEKGVVYRYYPELQKEFVYYDFTLNPVDIITVPTPNVDYQCKVTSVDDRTLTDGTSAREIHFSATPLIEYEGIIDTDNMWIEGIGNVNHPVMNIVDRNLDVGLEWIIMSVQCGEEIIYRHTSSGINNPKSFKDGRVYDIQGRPVVKDTQHGLVISNGRKYLAK